MYSVHRQKNGIYANISLFLSYSEVTSTTRSSPYPDQMVTAVPRIQSEPSPHGGSAPRDDLYRPECQRSPHQLDEPQRRIHRPRELLARGELAPRLSLVSPKVFFSPFVTDGVLVPCRCRLWLA
ncbi:hypothetical protein M9458_055213 [Cirrhinus mrigala]|uniref:Uncharacterized protein n=1 Tax=Cirrhinus mrigala TaxID=683832 RepID=A0ABD0MIH1_CIRMR